MLCAERAVRDATKPVAPVRRGSAQRLSEFEEGGDGGLLRSGFELLNAAQRSIGGLGKLFLGKLFFAPVLPKGLAKCFRNHKVIAIRAIARSSTTP